MSNLQKIREKSFNEMDAVEYAIYYLNERNIIPDIESINAADLYYAKNEAIIAGILALRAVIHDRPSAHTDDVWELVNKALSQMEEMK